MRRRRTISSLLLLPSIFANRGAIPTILAPSLVTETSCGGGRRKKRDGRFIMRGKTRARQSRALLWIFVFIHPALHRADESSSSTEYDTDHSCSLYMAESSSLGSTKGSWWGMYTGRDLRQNETLVASDRLSFLIPSFLTLRTHQEILPFHFLIQNFIARVNGIPMAS